MVPQLTVTLSTQLPLKAMAPTGSSSGTPGGWTGATVDVATCPSMIGIAAVHWMYGWNNYKKEE